jgi:hypothetical protein
MAAMSEFITPIVPRSECVLKAEVAKGRYEYVVAFDRAITLNVSGGWAGGTY